MGFPCPHLGQIDFGRFLRSFPGQAGSAARWRPCEDCVVVVLLCGCVSSLLSVCALCVVCDRGRGWLLLMRTRHTCTQSILIIISISTWSSQHFDARLFRLLCIQCVDISSCSCLLDYPLTIVSSSTQNPGVPHRLDQLPAVLSACYLLPATCWLPACYLPASCQLPATPANCHLASQ